MAAEQKFTPPNVPLPSREQDRWLRKLWELFSSKKGRDPGEHAASPHGFELALSSTPYPLIFQMLVRKTVGLDAQAIQALATEAFADARQAHRDGRPRTTIIHLYSALAYNTLAGNLDDTATSLGNLAMEFSLIGDYPKATVLQEAALVLKRDLGRFPANIARSLLLLAEADYYMGDYTRCRQRLAEAQEIHTFEEIAALDAKAQRAIELRGNWDKAVNTYQSGSVRESMRDARAYADSGEPEKALLAYAHTVACARRDRDVRIEMGALFSAASLFYVPLNMYGDAAEQADRSARLAEEQGLFIQEASALKIKGQSLSEAGHFSAALLAFQEGLAALQHSDISVLNCELAGLLSFALLSSNQLEDANVYLDYALDTAARLSPVDALQQWFLVLGHLFRADDFLEAAMRVLRAGVELFEKLSLATHRVVCIYEELARCCFVLNRPNEAIEILDRGIRCAEEAKDDSGQGRSYVNMAWAYLRMNDVEAAKKAIDQAEPHVDASADKALQVYFTDTGMEIINRETAKLLRDVSRPELEQEKEIGTFGHEGMIHSIKIQIEEMENAQNPAHGAALASAYDVLGSELDREGRFQEAGCAFLAGLRVARQWNLPRLRGFLFHDYGVLRVRSGKLRSGRRSFAAALACKDRFAGGEHRLSSLTNLAQADVQLERTADFYSLASQIESEALRLDESQSAPLFIQVAVLFEAAGHLDKARGAIERALKLVRLSGPKESLILALNTSARLHLASGNVSRTESIAREALDTVESHWIFLKKGKQAEWQKYNLPAVETLLETLFQSGGARACDALQVVETAKVRSLLQRFGLWRLQQPEGFPDDLKSKEDEVLSELRMRDYAEDLASDATQFHSIVDENRVLSTAQEFWTSLPEEWQEYGRLRQGKPIDPVRLVKRVSARDSAHFVVIYPTSERTLLWHLASDGSIVGWHSLPLNHEFFANFTPVVVDAMANRRSLPQEWASVSHALTERWVKEVPEESTICFVPSRSLMELPLALLTIGRRFLIERNPIAYVPSISLFGYWTGRTPVKRLNHPIVLGDSLGDLDGARREALQVAQLLGTTPLLGREVLRLAINSMLGGCDVLHISCHAHFNNIEPELSGFLLADGTVFSARDVAKLRLNASLAVLSACESGRVQVSAGDELTGVSSGMLAAGFRAMLATSWKVPDRATQMLISDLYSALLKGKMSLAAALRTAQRGVASDTKYTHPYYWAAFRVFGDWRNYFGPEMQDEPKGTN
jgi:tetratricopeptide (TPR) repeat protein